MDKSKLKTLLKNNDPSLFSEIKKFSLQSPTFTELSFLSTLRKKNKNQDEGKPLKIALLGSPTLYPLSDFLEHYLTINQYSPKFFIGEFDNYIQEILNPASEYHQFEADITVVIPTPDRLLTQLQTTMSFDDLFHQVNRDVNEHLSLLDNIKTGQVITTNFMPLSHRSFGPLRSTLPFDPATYIKTFNTTLGQQLHSQYKICDLEYLACEYGTTRAYDPNFYFETKNIFAPDFLPQVASELALVIDHFKSAMKKVLICDLDHTLWGGIIGDDGIEGIELGGSTKGQAFVKLQKTIKDLKKRGVILCLCSKNEESIAMEAIENHPEMVLRKDDFVAWKINWNPKSENIKELSEELNLGLDSFVFIDDNPAEIEIVNQYVPAVATITMDGDPSEFASRVANSRYFEPRTLTAEDSKKTGQYQQEYQRKSLQKTSMNMDEYLKSLEMTGNINDFQKIDVPRISQLINKSNQFNFTTIRRSEAEVIELINNESFSPFTIRLQDKFGDYGLISVIILEDLPAEDAMAVNTWIMSCRVLKREVEHLALNKMVEIAKARGRSKIKGLYYPTKKNIIVKDLYPELGFEMISSDDSETIFSLNIEQYNELKTSIELK